MQIAIILLLKGLAVQKHWPNVHETAGCNGCFNSYGVGCTKAGQGYMHSARLRDTTAFRGRLFEVGLGRSSITLGHSTAHHYALEL